MMTLLVCDDFDLMEVSNAEAGPSNSTNGVDPSVRPVQRPAPVRVLSGEARHLAEKAGRPVVKHPSTNSILINSCKCNYCRYSKFLGRGQKLQKGNPLMNHIRNVAWEWSDIVPDYQVGATTGVLYLSIRYHRLHPEYIHNRIQKLGQMYHLRILLIYCDVSDHQDTIKEMTKVAIINNLTIMLAWNNEEAARYLEIYKQFERKGPELIKERVENDYMSQMNAVLTSVKGVNKTDVMTLTTNFGSLKRIASATADELAACPGLGEKKVKRLRDAFTQPFMVSASQRKTSNAQKRAEMGVQSLN